MATNAEIEMRWVNAWNDLFDLAQDRPNIKCQLPDYSVVDVEACKAWLQEMVYAGHLVQVDGGWIEGRPGILASCHRPEEIAP